MRTKLNNMWGICLRTVKRLSRAKHATVGLTRFGERSRITLNVFVGENWIIRTKFLITYPPILLLLLYKFASFPNRVKREISCCGCRAFLGGVPYLEQDSISDFASSVIYIFIFLISIGEIVPVQKSGP